MNDTLNDRLQAIETRISELQVEARSLLEEAHLEVSVVEDQTTEMYHYVLVSPDGQASDFPYFLWLCFDQCPVAFRAAEEDAADVLAPARKVGE